MPNPLKTLLEQRSFMTATALEFIRYGSDVNTQNDLGYTLLHRLVTYDHSSIQEHNLEAISTLVNSYKADINTKNKAGQTPLQSLIDQNSWPTNNALFLINLGADPNTKDSKGEPLIHRLVTFNRGCIREHNLDAIHRLVRTYKVDINTENKAGQTPLQALIDQSSWPTNDALYLISLGADPNTKDSKGESLIHRLVTFDQSYIREHNLDAIKKLVRKYKVDIDSKNNEGKTPLQCLMDKEGGFKIAEALFLVILGANPNVKNAKGETLLHIMATSEDDYSRVIKELVEKFNVDTSITNSDGQTPFDVGVDAIQKNKIHTAVNANVLIDCSEYFNSKIKSCFKENKEELSVLNKMFASVHSSEISKKYEFQGKIRGKSFQTFKESLNELSSLEKLNKLKWAKTQSIFCDPRSNCFLSKLSRTNTVKVIDEMITAIHNEEKNGFKLKIN